MIIFRRFFPLFLVLFIFLCEISVFGVHLMGGAPQIKCVEKEKQALLKFKQGLSGTNNQFSSWEAKEIKNDCCRWQGVRCHNRTGNVIELSLSGDIMMLDGDALYLVGFLSGVISPSLLELKFLEHLEFSSFNFSGSIPVFFGSFTRLKYIGLYKVGFQGRIPCELGNLSSLQELALIQNQFLFADDLEWLLPLQSLRNLYLSHIDLSKATDWLKSVNKLPLLRELRLSSCQLPHLTPSLMESINSFTSLTILDVSHNNLGSSIYNWLFNYSSSLNYIYLSNNSLQGPISHDFAKMVSLVYLDLSSNKLEGGIPSYFSNYSSLESLDLSNNNLSGRVSESNMLNLSQLKVLNLSLNSHLELKFQSNWIPPFNLGVLNLRNCKIGPYFPKWLQTQTNIFYIDISGGGISDQMPDWFWDQMSKLEVLNLSYNQISGTLPKLDKFSVDIMDLSSNNFKGPIPSLPAEDGISINLSKNKLSGKITFLCNSPLLFLQYLDLSDNHLFGQLPDCWDHLVDLAYLSLANNNFSGKIPHSMGFLSRIEVLQLRNNSFTEELPQSWRHSEHLNFIDFGQNRLSGTIPSWIGSNLTNLVVLSLSSNNFSGNIPQQFCDLSKIQILDLSGNNISGTIPKCISNFSAMAWESNSILSRQNVFGTLDGVEVSYTEEAFLIWKGRESQYKNTLGLAKIIDLSSNNLTGFIPVEITSLVGLLALNLSRNCITGNLPAKIGDLTALEFLDLSENRLFGEIHSSLSQLSFLGVLNLSFNNFSGRIPPETHLQTFDASSFEGNLRLCGKPLTNACPGDKLPQNQKFDEEEHEEKLISTGFFVSMALGFILGFWGVCGTLFLNRSCRHSFFKFLKEIEDWIYTIILLNLAKLKRRLQG